jgi:GntP family gluconate:H+ symporter
MTATENPGDSFYLLLIALAAVAGLIVLVARYKMHSFLALILAALFAGVCSGMPLADLGTSFQNGVGAVLGSIAMVLGLGTVLGKVLAESGGAERIAKTLIETFGPARLDWAMAAIAFLVGIPVFFSVGLVLLVPILFAVAQSTHTPLLRLAIPLLAGLSVVHGLVPPHPGPMAALAFIGADMGKTILLALLVGALATAVAGPLLGSLLSRLWRIQPSIGVVRQNLASRGGIDLPGFGVTLFAILLPVGLMLLGTVADVTLADSSPWKPGIVLVSHPIMALLIAVIFSFRILAATRGLDRRQLSRFTEESLGPIAAILLIVGAGGGFSRVLVDAGVGDAIAAFATGASLSPLLLGWLVAATIRVATGSATVAITTAAGILAPIAHAANPALPELLILSMGAGSLILSHVNDGGFWLVKEFFGLTVIDTLKTWTVLETVISLTALGAILLVDIWLN